MAEEITIDEFRKIDLRTAKVIHCERVEKSRNLLKIVVKMGSEEKQIVSGISNFYEPEELIGKTLIVVANLKKARLMGLESQGMVLTAEDGDFLSVATTDRDSPSGLRLF